MKQLFKIGFDLSLASLSPIASWFLLGVILDANLVNIFSLTYPLQFLWLLLKDIFAVGGNLLATKTRNPQLADAGIIVGTLISGVIFGILALNIDGFIRFMNMDPQIYREFSLYIVLQLWIQLIVMMAIEKLYYADKNTLANKYSTIFNSVNFVCLIGSSLLTKNKWVIVGFTLMMILSVALVIVRRELRFSKIKFNVLSAVRLNSMDILENSVLFFVYLLGIGQAFSFGAEYALAITFATLVTDIQWDVSTAIQTKAKIDIAKNRMNFKTSFRDAYVLIAVLVATSVAGFVAMKNFYQLNLILAMIYTGVEYLAYCLYPQYRLKMDFLQLKYSAKKATAVKFSAMIFRLILVAVLSSITPFALVIGQLSAQLYQVFWINLIFHRNYKILKNGKAIKKVRK